MWSFFYDFVQHIFQRQVDALCGVYRCDHQLIGIHTGKIQPIACVLRQLGQKHTLRTPIPFPERMQLIGPLVEVQKLLCKTFP